MIGYPNTDSNKKSYYREYIQRHAKNSKETWNKINQILNNKKSGPDNIYFSKNGIITDPKQLANLFNNYFVTVPEKITKRIGQTNNKYQVKNSNEHSMYLTEIGPDEMKT